MTIPVTPDSTAADTDPRPLTMFGPDFPFAYDDYVAHPRGSRLGARRPSTAPRSPSSAAGCRGSSPRTS